VLTLVENTRDFSPGNAAILGEVSVGVVLILIVVSSASEAAKMVLWDIGVALWRWAFNPIGAIGLDHTG
jgi:hypothetical protein